MSKKPRIKAGDIFTTNEGCEVQVLRYDGFKEVLIRFNDDHAHEVVVQGGALDRGTIKNPFHRSVYGIGFVGVGDFRPRVDGRGSPEYDRWFSMMRRCYCPISHKRFPSYIGCTVTPAWHNFQNFSLWAASQKNWLDPGYELDKDFIVQGNREYGPDTCVLSPKRINSIAKGAPNSRGMPLGVSRRDTEKTYLAQAICNEGKRVRIGRFSDPITAFKAVKDFTEKRIKELADSMRYEIDPRLYEALMKYEVQP